MAGAEKGAAAQAIIRPQPGPQTAFLASPADIAIYGGSAGGGKTWALLMEPLRHVANGLADRINRYGRVALVLLGYRPDNVRQFQADHRLEVDGDVGPKTRAALHQALVALVPGEAERPEVKAAPVTEEKTVVEEKPVAVTPPSLDAPGGDRRRSLSRPSAVASPPRSMRSVASPGKIC